MKTGLVSVSFRKHTPKEIIIACNDAGIAAIEWGSDVHAKAGDKITIKEIAEAQSFFGMHTSSYGTYFRVGRNSAEEIYDYIESARLLGTDTLRIWCGDRSFSDYGNEQASALIEECRCLAQIAEKEEVTLCTELHIGTFTDSPIGVLKLHDAIGSNNFKTYWQPNQYKSIEYNIESAKSVALLTENIHVFNWKGDEKYPLTDAVSEWKSYFAILPQNGYALLEFMPDGRLESLGNEISALQKILGKEE